VCTVPVDNEEALHHSIVDAYQTIRNYPGRVEACVESHGKHFGHLL
jgi:hypothetical protein